ncbi:hypothetical protein SAMN04488540_104249 [Ferrimonas sediminum]|uniref:Uncharacterized protein n=1 Tax=Ferrimonas sediminum TaxID=718193 RepID=A0A1G8QBV6_9GAMM|nr:hypothetical protein SAMN04488540_104249 [Ferrimonas sediminum]
MQECTTSSISRLTLQLLQHRQHAAVFESP